MELDVSEFNTSKVTNMSSMFASCSLITELDLDGFDTSNVINMSSMFHSCGVVTLDLDGFDTSKVTDMERMFQFASNLTILNIGNFDTSKVTDMSYMFFGCYNLKSLDLNKWDTSNVTEMDNMFQNCNNLETLNISNRNTSNVTDMWSMLRSCGKLTSLDLYNRDTSKVSYFTYMFESSSNIEKIYVWSKFRIENNASTSSMFWNLNNIVWWNWTTYDSSKTTGIYARVDRDWVPWYFTLTGSEEWHIAYLLPWWDFNRIVKWLASWKVVNSYNEIDNLITKFERISDIDDVPEWAITWVISSLSSVFPVYAWYADWKIQYYSQARTIEMNRNSSYMFYNMKALEEIDVSKISNPSIKSISYMFNWCNNLSWVSLDWFKFSISDSFDSDSTFNDSSVKYLSLSGWKLPRNFSYKINNMLNNSSVEVIDVSNRDLSNTENINYIFYNTPIKKITWIKTWTWTNEKLKDMSYMFQWSYNLEEIDMSDMDFSKVTTVYEMFQWHYSYWSKLKKINLSNTRFDSLENMGYLCEKCNSLEEIDLSNMNINIWNNVSYGSDGLFKSAYNLEKLNLDGFWKVTSTNSRFENNYSLTWLDLRWLDTSETTNMSNMFYNSNNLNTIYVSDKFITDKVTTSDAMFLWAISLVWWNWTKYDPNNVDVTYARIDNEYQSWYFTDPNHFAVRYLTLTWEELLKQWISTGQTVEELEDSHRSYSYYTSWDLQTWFDFTEPLYGYTEIYVTWDDVKRVIYEYWTWVEEWIISSWSCLIQRDNNSSRTKCINMISYTNVV